MDVDFSYCDQYKDKYDVEEQEENVEMVEKEEQIVFIVTLVFVSLVLLMVLILVIVILVRRCKIQSSSSIKSKPVSVYKTLPFPGDVRRRDEEEEVDVRSSSSSSSSYPTSRPLLSQHRKTHRRLPV